MSGIPSPDDWWSRYLREQEERQRRADEMAKYLAPALQFLGIDTISIAFDGYGDDGEVQPPVCTPAPAAGLPEGLETVLSDVAMGLLPGGWEINGGSFGSIEIRSDGKTKVEQNWREEEDYEDDEEDSDDFDDEME